MGGATCLVPTLRRVFWTRDSEVVATAAAAAGGEGGPDEVREMFIGTGG